MGTEEREGVTHWSSKQRPSRRGLPKGTEGSETGEHMFCFFLNMGSKWIEEKLNYSATLKVIH